jgi:uncharacterized protein (DUF779 family)
MMDWRPKHLARSQYLAWEHAWAVVDVLSGFGLPVARVAGEAVGQHSRQAGRDRMRASAAVRKQL